MLESTPDYFQQSCARVCPCEKIWGNYEAMNTTDEFLTTSEVAAKLRCTVAQIHRLTAANRIPFLRLGGRGKLLFRWADVESALVSSTKASK
jgi:excisionase family DNA binding protein